MHKNVNDNGRGLNTNFKFSPNYGILKLRTGFFCSLWV